MHVYVSMHVYMHVYDLCASCSVPQACVWLLSKLGELLRWLPCLVYFLRGWGEGELAGWDG